MTEQFLSHHAVIFSVPYSMSPRIFAIGVCLVDKEGKTTSQQADELLSRYQSHLQRFYPEARNYVFFVHNLSEVTGYEFILGVPRHSVNSDITAMASRLVAFVTGDDEVEISATVSSIPVFISSYVFHLNDMESAVRQKWFVNDPNLPQSSFDFVENSLSQSQVNSFSKMVEEPIIIFDIMRVQCFILENYEE